MGECKHISLENIHCFGCDKTINDIEYELQEKLKQVKKLLTWIQCKDELPDEGQDVLVRSAKGKIQYIRWWHGDENDIAAEWFDPLNLIITE